MLIVACILLFMFFIMGWRVQQDNVGSQCRYEFNVNLRSRLGGHFLLIQLFNQPSPVYSNDPVNNTLLPYNLRRYSIIDNNIINTPKHQSVNYGEPAQHQMLPQNASNHNCQVLDEGM